MKSTSHWVKSNYRAYFAEFVHWSDRNHGADASIAFLVDREKHGDVLTVALANELLETANAVYKEKFGKTAAFNWMKIDMSVTEYDENNYLEDGVSHPSRFVSKKIGIYDKRKNRLTIYVDDVPVYENWNGSICRDSVAIMDG